MIAAQMAQQIVRAAHEVTEEREVITEVTTEQVEVIKKAEVRTGCDSWSLVPEIEKLQMLIDLKCIVAVSCAQVVEEKVSEVQLMAPVFEIPLQDITVTDGEKATFECRVTGVPMPSVTWSVRAGHFPRDGGYFHKMNKNNRKFANFGSQSQSVWQNL